MIDPKFVSEWNMKLQWGQKKKTLLNLLNLLCLASYVLFQLE